MNGLFLWLIRILVILKELKILRFVYFDRYGRNIVYRELFIINLFLLILFLVYIIFFLIEWCFGKFKIG